MILSTCRMSCYNLLRISGVDRENGKLRWRLDLACQDRFYFWINCQNLFRFSRIRTFNEKWKIAVNIRYVKLGCIVYAGYELLNCFDFRMRPKHGNRDEQICRICTLDRRIVPFIRVKEFWVGVGVGRLLSGEVNNFSRYIVESPAQSLGIIRQISLSLKRFFSWKRECSLPYKY